MWKDLNIQQKSELIKDYVRNGITSLSDMQAMYDRQSQEQAPVRTFINGQPKWRPRVLGGEGRPRPRQMTLDDAVALATDMAYEQIRQERERGYAYGGNLFEDGGDTERDKLWRQVYNSRGNANLPYEQAKDYDVKYYPDGSIMPMTYEEWVEPIKKSGQYSDRDGTVTNKYGQKQTLGEQYDLYRRQVEQDNSDYLKLKYPGDINMRRTSMGLDRIGHGKVTNDLFTAFGAPLAGAMMLPAASGLAGTGVATALGEAATEAVPWMAKNVVRPALSKLAPGGSFWTNPITRQMVHSAVGGTALDAASTLFTGNTIGGNVRQTVSDLTGWEGPSNEYARMGYDMVTDMANLGYMWGAKIPSWGLAPLPIAPSKMNPGSNLGAFDGSKWKDWGAESLVRWDDDFFYKVPKIEGSAGEIKTFPNHGFRYRYAVEDKLAANKIPSFEPYEYIGYHTTDKGYLPVFRQKKLSVKNMLTPEGKQFNKEAYNDIVSELEKHPNWNVFDYNLGHNIGKNEEGVGKLYDAWYSSNLFKWANRHFPREWELSPVGISRVLTNQIKNYAKE